MPPKRSQKSQAQTSELPDGAKDIVNSSELITAISDPIPLKNRPRLHLFATILTYAAPSSNHHSKGDDNDNPLQTITKQGRDYPVISPYAIREALRRILSPEELPYNRQRSTE